MSHSPIHIPSGLKGMTTTAHIALLLSKMRSLMKISKSCSKVIRRTLQFDKNWLRCSSFDFTGKITHVSSVTNFRKLQISQTHTLVEDAPCKSVLISSIEKVSIFWQYILEKSPQYRHFIREIAVSENGVLLVLSRFLVDPLPVLVSP